MSDPTLLAILGMALATLITRVSGPLVMMFVPLSPRVERFLESLSVSVIAAIVASYLAQNGLRESVAVACAALVMLGWRQSIWSMLTAMAIGAGWVAIFG